MGRISNKTAFVIIACLLAALSGGVTAYFVCLSQYSCWKPGFTFARTTDSGNSAPWLPNLSHAAGCALKSNANIYAGWTVPEDRQPFRDRGAGVIISPDGYIVTSAHLIRGADTISVKLVDNRIFTAKTVGADPLSDIALLKVEADGLDTIPFGNVSALQPGEWVVAVGNPEGLENTITAGVVSAPSRRLSPSPRQPFASYIQTDAAINRGNSGGALVNSCGELVGINTMIKSQTGQFNGYAFAVPADVVRSVITELRQYGAIRRASLGMGAKNITPSFIETYGQKTGINKPEGLYVTRVTKDGAAANAGIRPGDIIVGIDSTEPVNSSLLLEILGSRRPGDRIMLRIKRDNRTLSLRASLSGNTDPQPEAGITADMELTE